MTAMTTPDDGRPVIVGRRYPWVRLRWPGGREQLASVDRGRQLGAVDPDHPTETTAGPTSGA